MRRREAEICIKSIQDFSLSFYGVSVKSQPALGVHPNITGSIFGRYHCLISRLLAMRQKVYSVLGILFGLNSYIVSLKYLENKRTQKGIEKIKPAKLLPISFNQLSVKDSSETISLIVWPWKLATYAATEIFSEERSAPPPTILQQLQKINFEWGRISFRCHLKQQCDVLLPTHSKKVL